MKSLRKSTDITLEWKQTGAMERSYELRGEGDLLATLAWEKAFGSLATAVTKDGTWTFKRSGFLRPMVSARTPGSDAEVAVFRVEWGGGGEVFIEGKRMFLWKRRGFWSGHWGFEWVGGGPILHFEPKFALLKKAASVHLEPATHSLPELPLLATMGWYLLILQAQEEAAVTTIITS